ncbi:sulfite exporter TauE/SafE family protein [Mesorhizobium sp. AR02]|uniref:sulfite exporter TauE/SafE family protein n=1 Tax=Mesorhizobium sp. AR02 TaxID=2865837 RepID=UPI002160F365|nr:sulfite exporter TauE/SafE family protein [Mesorhizobium sp. AR02]
MTDFILFAIVGFLAQAVDGAIGMAYGAVSSTVLLSFGVPPAQASAAVHAAEVFTTAASGTAHHYHRNIDWKLFWRLAPFGILGGCLGAFVLTSFDGDMVKPYVTTYLAVIGLWLFLRSFRKIPSNPVPTRLVPPLGAAGGFLDVAGAAEMGSDGGWLQRRCGQCSIISTSNWMPTPKASASMRRESRPTGTVRASLAYLGMRTAAAPDRRAASMSAVDDGKDRRGFFYCQGNRHHRWGTQCGASHAGHHRTDRAGGMLRGATASGSGVDLRLFP